MNDTYNPDVLSCLANLSNDEVFTPPAVVNQMLDLLPPELFRDSTTTFLDIGCKSGVFLREIAKRLITGLAEEIPDLQTRVDHILHRQVFGIATTELTSLVARRTLYCSKYPNCRYSASHFETVEGNIRFRNIPHEFVNGRCKWCGASEEQFGAARRKGLETHAYEFIHTNHPEEIFNMKFDVIVGNPPYQLSTGGSKAQATPLYNLFVEQAKKLLPRYLVMIIPDRWFAGGFGLGKFRDTMLNDGRITTLCDYPVASDCFPGVDIPGGICYFLWEANASVENCQIRLISEGTISCASRPLLEKGCDVFIKYNEAIPIIRKVKALGEVTFETIVSAQKPFGLSTTFIGSAHSFNDSIAVFGRDKSITFVAKNKIVCNVEMIDTHKVYTSAAYGERISSNYYVIGKPFYGAKGTACTETYVIISSAKTRTEADNIISYMTSKFFRFLVLLHKPTQHLLRSVYSFVPIQDFSKPWADAELYAKYKLTKDEISFIESMIKPME